MQCLVTYLVRPIQPTDTPFGALQLRMSTMSVINTQIVQSALLAVAPTATQLQQLHVVMKDYDGDHPFDIQALVQHLIDPSSECLLDT